MPDAISPAPEVILFDMDGVLVNTFHSWYESFVELFRDQYNLGLPDDEFLRRFWGRDLRDIFAELALDMPVPVFCCEYYGRHTDKVEIFKDTKATLASLNGYGKAVITNTPALCAELILRDLGISDFFDQIITGDDVALGKPDPAIVRLGCELLGCTPAQAVVIGDHQVDIEAARRAGSRVIGVGIDGDYRVETLSELLPLLSSDQPCR